MRLKIIKPDKIIFNEDVLMVNIVSNKNDIGISDDHCESIFYYNSCIINIHKNSINECDDSIKIDGKLIVNNKNNKCNILIYN